MGTKRVGLARTQALLENLKREVNLSTSTTLKGMNLSVTATTGAAGAGLTGDSSTSPQVFVQTIGGEIVTTVLLDLDGLVKESTVGDVIGADSSAAAYLFRYVEATHGVPYKLEMSCIVLPTGTNPLKDFDIIAADEAALSQDDSASGATNAVSLFAAAGNFAKGQTIQSLAVVPATNQYVYLAEGATSTNKQTFTAGKLVIKMYGRASF